MPAKDPPVSVQSAELIDLKLSSQKELLQRDVERLTDKISAADKRLDDNIRVNDKRLDEVLGQTSQAVDRFAVILSALGILVTVVLFLGGWAAYVSVQRKAKDDATEAAERASKVWFESAEKGHQTRMDELEQKFEHVVAGFHAQSAQVITDARSNTDEQIESLKRQSLEALSQFSSEQVAALAAQAQALNTEPESSYSFDDWDTKAMAAYSASQFEEASYYFGRASQAPAAGAANVARALGNRGVVLGQLNRTEDEVAVYAVVDTRYGLDADPMLREQVANALVNKGQALGLLKRREEAIVAYDEADRRYGGDPSPALREHVARALVNKGAALNSLNRNEEAVAVCEEVHRRYGSDPVPLARNPVARAMNIRGFAKLCLAKANWADPSAKKLLVEAEAALAQAKLIDPDSAVVLGNMAYAAWLGGRQVEAEQYFSQALRGVGGGAVIHKDTHGDFEIHPMPLDEGFRVLIDRLYAQWQIETDLAASSVTAVA